MAWFLLFLLLSLAAYAQPKPGFTANGKVVSRGDTVNVCIGSTIEYRSTATGPAGFTVRWSFQNGNPAVGTGAGPILARYDAVGVDSTLQEISSGTTKDSLIIYVRVSDTYPAQPDFTVDPATAECSDSVRRFRVVNPDAGFLYNWRFGDATTGTGAAVTHTYSAIGNSISNFDAVVTATNRFGCVASSTTKTVQVKQKPNAVLNDPVNNFRFCGNVGNATLTVYDASTPAGNVKFSINWGDSRTNEYTTPPSGITHVYPTGIYTITYVVTGSNGCTDTTRYTVLNISNPQIGAGIPRNTTGCAPFTVKFPISSFLENDASTRYDVYYGDGTHESYAHPPPDTMTHTYTTSSCTVPSNFFTFTINASNGCDVARGQFQPIRVYTRPEAKLTADPPSACVNTAIFFRNTSKEGYNSSCSNSTRYVWDFGNNVTRTVFDNAAQSVTYTKAGTYIVKLSAENSCGNSVDSIEVCISDVPTADFSFGTVHGCAPFTVKATNQSIAKGCALRYKWSVGYTAAACGTSESWDFQTGSTDTSASPTFVFLASGRYTITLDIVSPSCGPISISKTITVTKPPVISWNQKIPAFCDSTTFCPTATGLTVTNCGLSPLTYSWRFQGGLPAQSTEERPCSFFAETGQHTITLVAANECGADTVSNVITIDTVSKADAGPPQSRCHTTTAKMAAATPAIGTGQWSVVQQPTGSPAPAVIFSPANSPTATVSGMSLPGTYIFRWRVTNGACTSDAFDTLVLHPSPPKPRVERPVEYCLNEPALPLQAYADANDTLTWYSSFPSTGFSTPPTPITSLEETTLYYVTQTDTLTHCTSDTAIITVYVRPTITNNTIRGDQTLCSASARPAQLTQASGTVGGGNNVYRYKWERFNAGTNRWDSVGNGAGYLPNPVSQTTNFRRLVFSGTCSDTSNIVTITVRLLATPVLTGAQSLCAGVQPSKITGKAGTNGVRYLWQDSVANGNPQDLIHDTLQDYQPSGLSRTTYYRRKDYDGDCVVFSNWIAITIFQKPGAGSIRPVDTTVCLGSNVPVTAEGVSGTITAWLYQSPPFTGTLTAPPPGTIVEQNRITFVNVRSDFAVRLVVASTGLGNGCDGLDTSNSILVHVSPKPAGGQTTMDATVCSAANADTIRLSGYSGRIVRWETRKTGDATWGVIDNTTDKQPYKDLQETTWFRAVVSTNACPEVFSDTTIITVIKAPTVSHAGPDQQRCSVDSLPLQGNLPLVGTGQWTQLTGPTTAIIRNNTSHNTAIAGLRYGRYSFVWTITNGICPSSSDTVSIQIDTASKAEAGPDQLRCGDTAKMAAAVPLFGAGSWTKVSGPASYQFELPSSPTTTVRNLVAGTYVFRWTVAGGVCESSDDVIIEIVDGPTRANAGADQSLCDTSATTLTGNTPVYGSGLWSSQAGSTLNTPALPTTVASGLPFGTTVFRWTITLEGCPESSDAVRVTIYQKPTPADAGLDTITCADSVFLAANEPLVGEGRWTRVTGPNQPRFDNIRSANTAVRGLVTGTYTFRWTITNGACFDSSDEIKVVVTDAVTKANAGDDQFLCNATTATLDGNNPAVGVGRWWQIAGAPVTITDSTANNTIITGLKPDSTYQFLWKITGGNRCRSSADTVRIRIWPLTTPPAAGRDTLLCNISTPYTMRLQANAGRSFETAKWRLIEGPANSIFSDAASPVSAFTIRNAGRYVLGWQIANETTNGCPAKEDTIAIAAYEKPVAGQVKADSAAICLGENITLRAAPVRGILQKWQYRNAGVMAWTDTSVTSTTIVFTNVQQSFEARVVVAMPDAGATCGVDESSPVSVRVNPLPPAGIIVDPASRFLQQPDYTFKFRSAFPNPAYLHLWDFGDRTGQTRGDSATQYKYSQPGLYIVTLTVTNPITNCKGINVDTVRILAVPGYLHMPNAMCIGCTDISLRQFLPMGKGLANYRLRIYNKWGQLQFETSKLGPGGIPLEPWPGPTSAIPGQDTFMWVAEGNFANGTEWKGMVYPPGDRPVKSGFITFIK